MRLKVLETCGSDFVTKALEDGSVYVEGWANKATVDRGKDLIGKKAWNIENYKKNSIMLFNHDHSKPIGKMIEVEPKDEGLYIKGRISNSKDPEISRIRDLVKEGILNSLSVGIMVSDEEQKDGINHVKSAELHEISIVAVPMQQDSQFQVTAKALQGSMLDSLETITASVGYKDVEKACHLLHSYDDVFESVDSIAERIAGDAQIEKEKALAFLRMELKETPVEITSWLTKSEESEEPEEKKGMDDGQEVQAISVPKSEFGSVDELKEWAEASGWSSDNIAEDDDKYVLVQRSQDQFEGDLETIDMGDGVSALVGKMKEPEGEPEPEGKGLLDDQDPMTQPVNGNTAADSEVNPSLDQAKQTNVLLSNMISLLQQLNEKFDMMVQPTAPPVSVEAEKPEVIEEPSEDEDEELAKKIESFIMKTNERLSQLGL